MAYVVAASLANGISDEHEDCESVIRDAAMQNEAAVDESKHHVGIWREQKKYGKGCNYIRTVTKVKAHEDINNIGDPELKRMAEGNDKADRCAKEAVGTHPRSAASRSLFYSRTSAKRT